MAQSNRTSSNGRDASEVHILLVEPKAELLDAMRQHLADSFSDATTMQCSTLASARAFLSGNHFDLVVTADKLPDGTALELLGLRDALGFSSHVFVCVQTMDEACEAAIVAGASACMQLTTKPESLANAASEMRRALGMPEKVDSPMASDEETGLSEGSAAMMLEELRRETGAVAHAINNPLTVITGNAQFIMEVARNGQADPSILGPIEDINAATQQLSDAVSRLSALRERISAKLGTADHLKEDER